MLRGFFFFAVAELGEMWKGTCLDVVVLFRFKQKVRLTRAVEQIRVPDVQIPTVESMTKYHANGDAHSENLIKSERGPTVSAYSFEGVRKALCAKATRRDSRESDAQLHRMHSPNRGEPNNRLDQRIYGQRYECRGAL